MHVDAAHGGSFLLHSELKEKLTGIDLADSVVWDLHKMMLMPSLNTAVMFRDGGRSYEAFNQEASYLFGSEDPREQWYNLGQRTLECTKRGLGAVPYLLLQHYGTGLFADYVGRMVDLARSFAERIRQRRGLSWRWSLSATSFAFAGLGSKRMLCRCACGRQRWIGERCIWCRPHWTGRCFCG